MKIVLAPDSFKESLSAPRVCCAMERGIRHVLSDAEIVSLPLADGGEGTVEALAAGGRIVKQKVVDPLGNEVNAEFGLLGDGQTAVIEMAAASGLPLVPLDKRNPLHTTTFGTGQLIKAALDLNISKIIIGIGGSATNDAGTGMAQALGVTFYHDNQLISDYMTGHVLARITHIDLSGLDTRLKNVEIKVACDVDNPLLGERGAAKIYSPQKGATPEIVQELDANMEQAIAIIENATRSVRDIPGSGAAGGLGAGLVAFLNAEMASGIDTILETLHFDRHIRDADLILTGEGKIDEQSAMGKTIAGVLDRAVKYNVPVIALGGIVFDNADVLYEKGLLAMFSICDGPMDLAHSMADTKHLIEKTCVQIMRLFTSRFS